MEDDISEDIYGDLGDFEFNEKIKEQIQEIASLNERLNQSVVTITDLQEEIKSYKKKCRVLEANASSLHKTAKLELSRKQREIGELKQKIDNRIFRRPNNCSKAIQTEDQPDTFTFQCKIENDVEGTPIKPEQHQQTMNNACIPMASETVTKFNNALNDPSKYRIPKKNPFARHENRMKNEVSPCDGNDMENSHDQRKYDLPKKKPQSRWLDGEEDKSIASHVSRSDRRDIDEEKSRIKDRGNETKNNRRHSPVTHTARKHRDDRKFNSNVNDHKREVRRYDRKDIRGRSSSGETCRHSKHRRSDSTSKRRRSRSRSSRNAEKRSKTKSPKRSHSKPYKEDLVGDTKLRMDSVSDLKEKDLEAMLIAQKKILHEIASNDSDQLELKETPSKKRRKRKTSNNLDNPAKKSSNNEKIEDCNSAINHTNVAAMDPSQNTVEMLATDNVAGNQINSIGCDVRTENVDVQPLPTSRTNSKLILDEIIDTPTSDAKLFSPFSEFFAPIAEQKKLEKSTVGTGEVADSKNTTEANQQNSNENCIDNMKDLPAATSNLNQELSLKSDPPSTQQESNNTVVKSSDMQKPDDLPNNDNSNSLMDLDYELMQRTSSENQLSLPCEAKDQQSSTEDPPNTISPIVNNNFIRETTQINASFIAMENSVPELDSTGDNGLNSSHERHILTKGSEYTVQDVGHEIRIFLTKKRKRNKNAKC